ncbi:EF-P 5-aminopentanol modification-associated protein YfmF [Lysinibacillus piscis]|uniref:Peptidase M16 n=1 Tax=Lysinibacillus piscis TaxID=2518931 RepID=A0ABQ5NG60_9BACI|nr:pitrilysin family protein [Lysinibacillus sp. KH24]GLC87331.1 peptidase M16 [Lysinibacillus sp. KH24]
MFKKIPLAEGVHLHIRHTTQFKTVNFSIKWRTALTTQCASERTVLTNVLQHSNAKYPTTAAFRSYLDDLYGTVLYFDTSKRGNEHVVLMNVETVNDQYLADANVLNKVLDVMQTAIFQPNLENGAFKNDIVQREKKMVIQRIESIFDDKARFAQQRLQQILRPDEPASISANGTVEDIQQITAQSLFATYQSMLANDTIDIYVAGDINEEEMVEKLRTVLPFTDRTPAVIPAVLPQQHPQKDYVREQHDMKQGKLHVGFSTPVYFGDADFTKMQVFNGVFGGYPHAKLFMNVREKESLAYYASSIYASHYGLIFVVSGIEPKNEEKALTLIKEQLTAIQAGDISDLELEQTKAMLTNQLKEALDSARGQIEIFDQYKELPEPFTVETWVKKWQAVTKEDIVDMAKQVQLEAVYFLCGKEQSAQ